MQSFRRGLGRKVYGYTRKGERVKNLVGFMIFSFAIYLVGDIRETNICLIVYLIFI